MDAICISRTELHYKEHDEYLLLHNVPGLSTYVNEVIDLNIDGRIISARICAGLEGEALYFRHLRPQGHPTLAEEWTLLDKPW